MNSKVIVWISIAVAVVSASIASIVVTNNRATVARKMAQAAESREMSARSEEKKAKSESAAEASRQARAEAERQTAEENRKAKEAEQAAANATALAEREANERSRNEVEAARKRALAASDLREAEKLRADAVRATNDTVRAMVEREIAASNAIAQAAMATLATERLRAEKLLAESKLWENRRIDFETWQLRLAEKEQELVERERAVMPDKTAADLVWVGEREADEIGGDTNRVTKLRKRVRAEDDRTLPPPTRRLAYRERLQYEADTNHLAKVRAEIIGRIEPLLRQALKDDRIVDADFYYDTLKELYPDWNYRRSEEEQK